MAETGKKKMREDKEISFLLFLHSMVLPCGESIYKCTVIFIAAGLKHSVSETSRSK